MRTKIFFLFCVVCLFSPMACATFPKNPQLEQYDKSLGYRLANMKLGDKNSGSLFVILTFSGGGTRAASLSYGVLEALREVHIVWENQPRRLLDEIDIISSVSGGSFTAAYYAIHGDELFNGNFEQAFLKKDIEKGLFRSVLFPLNLMKLAGASYGRSDLAAQYYDEHIFHGATYGELVAKGKRPFVILNATDMTRGSQFPFIQDQFDLICSDLSEIAIARAVASSSAFPGLLTPLTFENHAGACGYEEPVWVRLAEDDRLNNPERAVRGEDRRSYYADPLSGKSRRDYIHLLDGGIADNIGLRGVLYSMESTDPSYSILRKINRRQVKKLVVIVVNAGTVPEAKRDKSPKVPGLVDVLTSTATIPLNNYSFDTVERLRGVIEEMNRGSRIREQCARILQQACPGSELPGGKLYSFDFYMIHVGFDFIEDPEVRFYFKNLPTTFSLPSETVDKLREIANKLLHKDPDFKRLASALQ